MLMLITMYTVFGGESSPTTTTTTTASAGAASAEDFVLLFFFVKVCNALFIGFISINSWMCAEYRVNFYTSV